MIQKRQKTVEKGRPVEKWDDYLKCWCEVKSLYGKELYTALEAKLENVMNFETRYCKALEALNTKEYRVVWGERIFKLPSRLQINIRCRFPFIHFAACTDRIEKMGDLPCL